MPEIRIRINSLKLLLQFLILLCAFCGFISAQGLPLATPQSVGMSAERLKLIDEEVNKAIADKKLPGAVVIIGRKGKIVYRKAFGNRALVPKVEPMTVDTIFDVASLTKVVATATSIMILVEQGKIRLSDTVGKFIPEIEDKDAKNVTIQQLLTHTSGYRPDFDLGKKWEGREGMLKELAAEKLRNPAGTRFVYSDIGFIVLGDIVNRTEWACKANDFVGLPSQGCFVRHNISTPIKLIWTEFKPFYSQSMTSLQKDYSLFAPTENIKGQQSYLGSKYEGDDKTGNMILRGEVHDPTSNRMNGVAGHAGLFSTADDLARYCQMILNGGILDGKRILSAATVARMTKPYVISEDGATRGLGFDMNTSFSANRGELFPLGSFGHTGFTGTSIWIDPASQTFVVFLSNRVHPDGKGDVTPLRAKVATIAASAINDLTPEKIREAEARYYSVVAPETIKFKEELARKQLENLPINTGRRAIVLNPVDVQNGIDVLEKNRFKELEGLRIGLVTNHTGRNRAGKQTIDLLKEAPNVKLVALFSPEHGIRGQMDEKISDSVDEKTGLPIYSLYGETRKPKPEQLQNLDAIVFDIQDIGTRFYTYISTLKGVLEEAAKARKPVFVLDRVNPINGHDVEGPIADADKLSFIAAHRIPVRHGMTIGEMAQMFNVESKIGADLRVIKMDGWQRGMWFDEVNQTWVNPSPNMRSLTEATLYPGIGLLEFTNISVGRGTDTPFEVIGAPWLDGQKLASYLNKRGISGVRFVPIKYTPKASVFKDQLCGGINIVIIDRSQFRPVKTGLEIAVGLKRLFSNDWQIDNYQKLIVNQDVFDRLKAGESTAEIEMTWQNELSQFMSIRARYLLY